MDWTVYILKCSDDRLYTGITNDLNKRLQAHEAGKGAKFTRGRAPFSVLYTETHSNRSEASKRELAIKALRRDQKIKLSGG